MKKSEKGIKKDSKQTYFSNKHLTVITIALFIIALFALSFVNVPQSNFTGDSITGENVLGNLGPTNTETNVNQRITVIIGDHICSIGERPTSPDCQGGNNENTKRNVNEDSFISDLFTKWGEGNLDINIAKFLLFFLLFMLIFSVLRFIGLFNGFLTAMVSLIVSFLATAYIIPAEVMTILTVYTALGLALSIAVPFFIMLAFSIALLTPYKVKDGHMVVSNASRKKMFQYITVAFLWLLFIGFLIYKIIVGWSILSMGMLIVILIILAIGLVFVIKPSLMARLIARYVWSAEGDRLRAVADAANLRRRAQAQVQADAGRDPLAGDH